MFAIKSADMSDKTGYADILWSCIFPPIINI